jgi:DNA-binding NtrC family response regulator
VSRAIRATIAQPPAPGGARGGPDTRVHPPRGPRAGFGGRGGRAIVERVAKILVVDDEQSMREFLGICLRRAGHEVTLAHSGGDAIEQLRSQPIDVVVSDLKMPGELDGLRLLQQIKDGAIQRAAVPGATPAPVDPEVILVTAFATTDTAIAAMKQGATT